jgi:hemolysin III
MAPTGRPHASPRLVTDVHGRPKPLLRGRLHSVAFAVSVPAGIGVVAKLVRFDHSAFGTALSLAMAWAAVAALPVLLHRLPGPVLTLMVLGGLLYTVGAIVLARRHPDPWPRVFGYHEIWHAMVVLGGACHFAVILHIVRVP